jgi:large subunit ribosomal protein L29
MALLRTKEIRAMDPTAREKKLRELRDELMHERGVAAMGGAPPNPGKIRALRTNIARIYTIQTEEGAQHPVAAPTKEPAGPERPTAEPKESPEELNEDIEEDRA